MSVCDATRTESLEIFCCNCWCSRILTVPAGKPVKMIKQRLMGSMLGSFSRCFSWHFKPIKMIAGDVHLRCHQDRKFGNFLLQLLVLSDFDGSGRRTCKKIQKILELPQKNIVDVLYDELSTKNLRDCQRDYLGDCLHGYLSRREQVRTFHLATWPSGATCYCCWYQVIDLEGVKS